MNTRKHSSAKSHAKPFIYVLTMLFFSTSFSLSQTDSSLFYYPLHIGDHWTYKSRGINPSYTHVEVLRDTLFSNGKTYFKLQQRSAGYTYAYFERVDSVTATVLHVDLRYSLDEVCFDSLRAAPGDKPATYRLSTPQVWCDSITSDTILGVRTWLKYFSGRVIPTEPKYVLARGFGLFRQSEYYEDPSGLLRTLNENTLVYAKINGTEYGIPVFVPAVADHYPDIFSLGQNYPNPFNSETRIRFAVQPGKKTMLTLHNVLGQKVREYTLGPSANEYSEFLLDAQALPTGTYIYTLILDNQRTSKKLLYLK